MLGGMGQNVDLFHDVDDAVRRFETAADELHRAIGYAVAQLKAAHAGSFFDAVLGEPPMRTHSRRTTRLPNRG